MTMSATSIDTSSTNLENLSSYQVITLLLDGALERVDGAIARLDDGEIDEAASLVQKTIAIVSNLRESLNFEKGGDIAINLDALYEYIVVKLDDIGKVEQPILVLNEVKTLLSEVHGGWIGIEPQVD